MSKILSESIRKFNYYLVFCDSKDTYITSFGFNEPPTVYGIKLVFDQLANEPDLIDLIPDWKNKYEFVNVKILKYKKFIKYLKQQEELEKIKP